MAMMTSSPPMEDTQPPAHNISSTHDPSSPAPFKKGDTFPSFDKFYSAVHAYATSTGVLLNWRRTTNKRAKSADYVIHRATCKRGGNYTQTKKMKGPNARPTRDSLKCGCDNHVSAVENSDGSVTIISLNLEHTNGCRGGADQETVYALKKRGGRSYPLHVLEHLRTEVRARRYGTHDVKSWLVETGFRDVTLDEATNLRYRLLTDMPIKNWKPEECSKEEMGEMQDYLYNDDLAKEVAAGSKESISNLQVVHNGLRQQIEGYDFRITTDSENRFSGTAWQTGRMRERLKRYGVMIYIDDTRSGVNTSNFCFWNVVVTDHEGKTQTVMGAMTMCASHEAAEWVLKSLVSMSPFASETIKATMSDLGKLPSLLLLAHIYLLVPID